MLFSSPVFLFCFLPLVLAAYALAGRSVVAQNRVLLAASLLFYGWGELRHLWLLALVGAVAWAGGQAVHAAHLRGRGDTAALTATIAAELVLLGVFKYRGFVEAQLLALGLSRMRPAQLTMTTLPLGISFFTFHAISYVMDIHRRTVREPASPLRFAVYLAMFPQLVAGPIVRYAAIAGQLADRRASMQAVASGIGLFIVGLSQKLLLADTLAVPADAIFALPATALSAPVAWLGAVGYSLQIYFDFAGYSNMAIGLARMMGLTLPANFRHPYASRSITEFWRRWHITLSRWFRDYLYIPLGGNRRGRWRTYANLWTVFLLCGLWHGPSWSFVLWGAYHGSFLVFERAGFGRVIERLGRPAGHAYALLAILFGWVLFRADTPARALRLVRAMLGLSGAGPHYPLAEYLTPSVATALAIGVLASVPWTLLDGLPRLRPLISTLRPVLLAIMLLLCVTGIAAGTYSPFIYFRF